MKTMKKLLIICLISIMMIPIVSASNDSNKEITINYHGDLGWYNELYIYNIHIICNDGTSEIISYSKGKLIDNSKRKIKIPVNSSEIIIDYALRRSFSHTLCVTGGSPEIRYDKFYVIKKPTDNIDIKVSHDLKIWKADEVKLIFDNENVITFKSTKNSGVFGEFYENYI